MAKIAKIILICLIMICALCACSKKTENGEIQNNNVQITEETKETEETLKDMLISAGVGEESAEAAEDVFIKYNIPSAVSVEISDTKNDMFADTTRYIATTSEGEEIDIDIREDGELMCVAKSGTTEIQDAYFVNNLAVGDGWTEKEQ